MREGLVFFFAAVLGFGLVFLVGLILWRPLINLGVDAFTKRLLKDPYPENIGEMYNVFAKVGVQNVLEADLRATSGMELERPFGTSRRHSPWDKLLLNPVYLTRKPIVEAGVVDTRVTLGPQAKRPMTIDIPVTIAGMAYGIGLSANAKIALAKAADQMNTATNTGVGPLFTEERRHVKRLVIQYHRGAWAKEEAVLRQADMIEIQFGYGGLGAIPLLHHSKDLSPDFQDLMGLSPGEALVEASLPFEVQNQADLRKLVNYLRELTNGVPIGVKFGATQRLEAELEIFTGAGIDFLSVAGAESGISFGPGIMDDMGLPTLPALCRTVNFLKKKGLQRRISLIISGGLSTPGHFLKALALGADAVGIGTVALLALSHTQSAKAIPFEPPTELVFERGKLKDKLDIKTGAQSVVNFLTSCNQEMILAMRNLGHTSLNQLSTADLCALTPEVAELSGAPLGLFAPDKARSKEVK